MTDVPGVLVSTISAKTDQDTNTGITVILPRKDWFQSSCLAGIFRFNGCGEMTGSHWIEETGLLTSPIVITGSTGVGDAYKGILEYACRHHCNDEGDMDLFIFPLVAETYDGYLYDDKRFAVKPEHVVKGIETASSGPVEEGNTGGGTGMICHRFKGGTGSSSRVVPGFDNQRNPIVYTVGVLVQANYGSKENLHIAGIPVGRLMMEQHGLARDDNSSNEPRKDGSIIVVIATDVPLSATQLQRVAKRATVGLAKVGGYGANSSGDIFLAFTTAAEIPLATGAGQNADPMKPLPLSGQWIDDSTINGVFEAAADATEEAIYNALCMADTMQGYKGRTVQALDLEMLRKIMKGAITKL